MMDDMGDDEHTSHDDAPDVLRALDDVVAPDRLRLAITAQVAGAGSRAPAADRSLRRRLGGTLAFAGAVAAVLLVLGVFAERIIDRGSAAPSVQEVAHVALRPASEPAPAARPGGELLRAQAGPISFPTWTRVGWRAVGARSDTIDGHELHTVFYLDSKGRRIGYAIADTQLPVRGGEAVTRRGAQLRIVARGGTSVVTWRRDGRTCILAGRDVPVERLLTLASYAA